MVKEKCGFRNLILANGAESAQSKRMTATIDEIAANGIEGKDYDWSNYDELTYAAWLIGRRIAGKPPTKEITEKQDGAAPKISLHPANWR